MGCCFSSSAPIVNHNSPGATKPPSPVKGKTEENPDHEQSRGLVVEVELTPPPATAAAEANEEEEEEEEEKPIAKVFSLSELRSATRNFRPDTVVGEGGFGTVFKGWVDEKTLAPSKVGVGIPIAVKKSNPDSEQGIREWKAEVEFLGKLSHRNLVRLLGYCCEDKKQFLLVYEYMQKGSLESHLFRRGADPLSWEIRLSIATGAAQGLAFLHNTKKQVIYRDFKASNILLDSDFGVKLSDFGLAKEGPVNGESHVSTRVIGTQGYAAPEYVATGHLYIKSDVYAFGVVLLELLTGKRVLDVNRPPSQNNLVEWTKPFLQDKRKLTKIVDERFEDQYPRKAAIQTGQLISNCLENDPRNRPSMDEVLHVLQQIVAIKMNSKECKTAMKNQKNDYGENDPYNRSPLRYQHVGPSNRAAGYRSPLPMSKPY